MWRRIIVDRSKRGNRCSRATVLGYRYSCTGESGRVLVYSHNVDIHRSRCSVSTAGICHMYDQHVGCCFRVIIHSYKYGVIMLSSLPAKRCDVILTVDGIIFVGYQFLLFSWRIRFTNSSTNENSDFLYVSELWRKILWPLILNPRNVSFLSMPRKLVHTKIKPFTVSQFESTTVMIR